MELRTLLKRVEPHERSNDQNHDGVSDEQPVEHHERLDDMVWLDDGCNGARPGNQQDDTESETAYKLPLAPRTRMICCQRTCEVGLGNDEVPDEVGRSPHDRENNSNDTSSE